MFTAFYVLRLQSCLLFQESFSELNFFLPSLYRWFGSRSLKMYHGIKNSAVKSTHFFHFIIPVSYLDGKAFLLPRQNVNLFMQRIVT